MRRQADLFQFRPPAEYDLVFGGFWLSHVPPARALEGLLGDLGWAATVTLLTPSIYVLQARRLPRVSAE